MGVAGIRGSLALVVGTLAVRVGAGAGCSGATATRDGTPPVSTPRGGADAATPAACSDGPRWPRGTTFAYADDVASGLPACTPHCGPNETSARYPGRLTSDALPSGPCTDEPTCVMAAEWLGPCPAGSTASGPLDAFVCRCAAGGWSCVIDGAGPGGSPWECSGSRDAGASEDGGG